MLLFMEWISVEDVDPPHTSFAGGWQAPARLTQCSVKENNHEILFTGLSRG
jgi:hypothetical protein